MSLFHRNLCTALPIAFWLLCLTLISGCGKVPEEAAPEQPPKPSATQETRPTKTQSKENQGELHLRVEKGVLIRQEPAPSSTAIHIVDRAQLLRVIEQKDGWYRVALPDIEGWTAGGEQVRELRVLATRRPPQPAVDADPDAMAAARRHLNNARERRCGPYALLTDVTDPQVLNLCTRLAEDLDKLYLTTYGLRPLGLPKETVVLFRDADSFRAFAKADGLSGYAGHAKASDGFLALYVGHRTTTRVAQTLVHELAHLIHRRALGGPLPRWLSEGLADGLGDPAGPSGLGSVEGLRGAEAMGRRVLEKPDLPDIETLLSQENQRFDRDPGSRDYEQSAVLIRYLMSDSRRATRFRAFLKSVAEGDDAGAAGFKKHVIPQSSWAKLDRDLRRWLQSRSR